MIMVQFLTTVPPAATIFAATNIDDLVVVSAFFAEHRNDWRTIVAGQFLGIGAIVILSILMAMATLQLPTKSFPYLGIVPLSLGIWRLSQWGYTKRQRPSANCEGGHPSRPGSTLFVATTVTMATGSDNVSVYVPFFAKAPHQIPLYSATFAFLAAVWCLLGYLLVNHIRFGRHLRGLRHVILPAVMILIGLWVLGDAIR